MNELKYVYLFVSKLYVHMYVEEVVLILAKRR